MPGSTRADPDSRTTLHATAVSWQAQGLLLLGPSGSGKSDLALRLIEAGAVLVADDQVVIERRGMLLQALPLALAGLIELRGQGIYRLPHAGPVILHLACELLPAAAIERLPVPRHLPLLGLDLPLVTLDPAPSSAVARLRLALTGERVA